MRPTCDHWNSFGPGVCGRPARYWRLGWPCVKGHVPFTGRCEGHPRCWDHADIGAALEIYRIGRHSQVPVRFVEDDPNAERHLQGLGPYPPRHAKAIT
jgi:hypothetical protein